MIPLFITMNVLPAGVNRDTPPDWEYSGRTIDAYVNRMLRAGFFPTLFVSPEATRAHAPMFEECIERGCEIGLLVSPSHSSMLPTKKPIGALDRDAQQLHIQRARDLFYDYMGFAPRIIRTGLYSGNQDTLLLCKSMGFTHSSIRLPGAHLAPIHTIWPSEHTIVHTPIIDIPVSTNPAERLFNRFPVYVSPEFGTTQQLQALVGAHGAHGHICVASNSVIDYFSPESTIQDNIDALILACDTIPDLVPMRVSQYQPATA